MNGREIVDRVVVKMPLILLGKQFLITSQQTLVSLTKLSTLRNGFAKHVRLKKKSLFESMKVVFFFH